ncbi:MAG: hypothetical protein M3O06_05375, partial [Pseudomonadota bacterium]|nr:hypothetical protein [Pseudomonadota bacterium]
ATVTGASTTCGGAAASLASTATAVSLSGANIPAGGSCTITLPVQTAVAGTYQNVIAAHALSTGPAGANLQSATATLTVSAPGGGSGGGGGSVDEWQILLLGAVWMVGRWCPARTGVGR